MATYPSLSLPLDLLYEDSFSYTTSASKDPNQDDPRFHNIALGVRYSQTLILYYHVSIILVISSLSLRHWTSKLRAVLRRRSERRRQQAHRTAALQSDFLERDEGALIRPSAEEVASSGSSTLTVSTASSNGKQAALNEATPLLGRPRAPKALRHTFWLRMRALLIYQPPPVPLIHKQLPDVGTSVFVSILLGINVFFLFFRCPLEAASTFVFADRAAVLFVANLPYLYILSAKNQPLQWLAGRSYEGLNIFHRRLGEWMCALALLHTGGMTLVWYTLLRPAGWSFVYFISRKIILVGLIAFVCYELIYLTSLRSVRQRLYEFFLATHIILQTSALVLLWFHHPRGQRYVAIALAIFLLDRLILRILGKTRILDAGVEVLDSSQGWVRVRVFVPLISVLHHAFSLRNGWLSTQHCFISIPALSKTHAVQAHPFTIASHAPPNSSAGAHLDLIVRAHDGFTRDIFDHARNHSTCSIRLDGPYGSSHALDMMAFKDVAIVVAAGTGISVAIPLLSALVAKCSGATDVERSPKVNDRCVVLVWVVRSRITHDQIFKDYLSALQENGVELIIPTPTAEGDRPEVQQLLLHALDNIPARHDATDARSVGIVSSAPNSMNRTVRNFCAQQAWQGRDIDVATEKFDW